MGGNHPEQAWQIENIKLDDIYKVKYTSNSVKYKWPRCSSSKSDRLVFKRNIKCKFLERFKKILIEKYYI